MSRDQPSPLNESERFNNMKQICLKYIFSTGMPTLEQFRSIYGKILTNSFSLRTDRYSFYVFTLIVSSCYKFHMFITISLLPDVYSQTFDISNYDFVKSISLSLKCSRVTKIQGLENFILCQNSIFFFINKKSQVFTSRTFWYRGLPSSIFTRSFMHS